MRYGKIAFKNNMKDKTNKKVKDSVVQIDGEISAEDLEKHRKKIFDRLKKDIETPGFRKGNTPDNIAKNYIDEKRLLEDAAYSALEEHYPILLEEYDIDPITPPHVDIKKLSFGNPISFSLSVGIKPEFVLPDYKKIAGKTSVKIGTVSDEEIETVIKQILEMKKTGENTDELTDEYVKKLGNFETVDEFRKKIGENLKEEKKMESVREKREKIAELLVKETKMTLPAMLTEDELARTMHHWEERLEEAGLSKKDYLEKIKKDEKDFLEEQKINIEKQYKTKFILEKIAEKENIAPTKEEIEKELSGMLSYHNNLDPESAGKYVFESLRNEKVIEFLERAGDDQKSEK